MTLGKGSVFTVRLPSGQHPNRSRRWENAESPIPVVPACVVRLGFVLPQVPKISWRSLFFFSPHPLAESAVAGLLIAP